MATKKKTSSKKPTVEAVAEVVATPDNDQGEPGDDLEDGPPMPTLFIGEPFALAGVAAEENDADGQFLEENEESGVPGCFASVLCGCGQPFAIDLLTAEVKACPQCDARYTHILVLGAESDGEIVGHTWHQLLVTNGLMPAEPEEESDEDGDSDAEPPRIPDANT